MMVNLAEILKANRWATEISELLLSSCCLDAHSTLLLGATRANMCRMKKLPESMNGVSPLPSMCGNFGLDYEFIRRSCNLDCPSWGHGATWGSFSAASLRSFIVGSQDMIWKLLCRAEIRTGLYHPPGEPELPTNGLPKGTMEIVLSKSAFFDDIMAGGPVPLPPPPPGGQRPPRGDPPSGRVARSSAAL